MHNNIYNVEQYRAEARAYRDAMSSGADPYVGPGRVRIGRWVALICAVVVCFVRLSNCGGLSC